MIIQFKISKEYAQIAIQHSIQMEIRCNTTASFRKAIKEYMSDYGHAKFDEHEYETMKFKEQANEIVERFFK
jgi:hypothetical protein